MIDGWSLNSLSDSISISLIPLKRKKFPHALSASADLAAKETKGYDRGQTTQFQLDCKLA